ncbi:MAG: phage holin family protein [Pseudomonadota bacterium]|uniref:phage holin family protein n=1 Tax=Roseovarius TaxID=74030 RepID=UPI0022A8C66B|nr:phage holin family protein [Roseovarius sp. EGI FJ00037]MCZ0812642.1 phage holin family protein [Roseovarius sp. EGI FJ00037]
MPGFLTGIEMRARQAVRSAGFAMIGVIFAMIGLGFLTAGLWVLIAAYEGALIAFVAIGALYLILGLCFLVLGRQPAGDSTEAHRQAAGSPAQKDPFVQIAEGFATGMQAGRAARDTRR